MSSGSLYIIATPIGNLEDITLRAIRVLKEADLVACEDTRVTRVLLDHYDIKTPTISYHQYSGEAKVGKIVDFLKEGKDVALVTDSGTPGISDPAQRLVAEIRSLSCHTRPPLCHSRPASSAGVNSGGNPGIINVVPIPGPSALAAAVSVSGLVDKEFYFAGFLPKKKGRQTALKRLSVLKTPVVVYESALRLERTLNDLKKYFGASAQVFLAREMTKKFEECWGGNLEDIITDLKNHTIKGEFVLIIAP